ncbi:MAG: TolC family protein [Myxococcota bacterium]|nr:TolC family protein [Myxococcota bacterium]MDW8362515.1 TolC family protein [Myxococcales bacterium]
MQAVARSWPFVFPMLAIAVTPVGGVAHAQSSVVRSAALALERARDPAPLRHRIRARVRQGLAAAWAEEVWPDPMIEARVWGVAPDLVRAPPEQMMIMASQHVPLGGAPSAAAALQTLEARAARIEGALEQHARAQQAELLYVEAWFAARRAELLAGWARTSRELRDARAARASAAEHAQLVAIEADLERVAAEVAGAQARRDEALEQLRELAGWPESVVLQPPAELPLPAEPSSLQEMLARASRDRPELAAADLVAERAGALEALGRARRVPSLRVALGAMLVHGRHPGWMLEAGVELPVRKASWRGLHARARATAEEARALREQALRQIRSEVAGAYRRLRAERERAERLRTTVLPALERAREVALAAYAAGGTLEPLVEALAALRDADLERLEAHAEALRAAVELTHATGAPRHDFGERAP